jgi:asparagine synthase (glutamine-hydrolysing)
MCGIFGFVGFEDADLLQQMGQVIRHRGPDGEGYYTDPHCSMGMRRLSIIDLAGGGQPIYNEDGSLVVCYNGEIYNYVELMDELQAKGHQFKTHCDTEVIVHAYEEWGIDCLQRFNGMFAFALYDVRRRELIIARDRAGQKPLYYHQRNGRFFFGSEIKSLLESPDIERRPNLAAIDAYLSLRYVPQPETLFGGVHTLPAGHYLRLRGGNFEVSRYWGVPLHSGRYRSKDEYREAFEELFIDAVRLTMRSDVPVGAYLSAGIDSSLVVAAMTRFTDKLNTFSIGFGSPIDETHEARRLAEHLGCTHHEVIATPEDFALLPKAIWHLERPIGDVLILAYYLLARETSSHVKVVLSGEGADESFAGYSFHKIIQWTEAATRWLPAFVPESIVAPIVGGVPVDLLDKLFVYPAHLGKKGQRKTADYLRHYKRRHLNANYQALKALFDLPERRELYSGEFKGRATEEWITESRDSEGPFLDRLLKLQFDDWLQDNLLLRQDKNTMAHSLELRCPFLDHRIIEMAFDMPPRLKIRGLVDKWVERDLARKLLPGENVKRSKNPFYFPLEYFHESSPIQELISMTLDEDRVRRRGYFEPASVRHLVEQMKTGEFLYLKQVLSLVILELWHMVFIDKQRMW